MSNYWTWDCARCGGTGWGLDEDGRPQACFECDATQLSVTATTYIVDAWPMDVTVGTDTIYLHGDV